MGDNPIVAGVGDILTFDLVMDFSDQPTLGGGFDINFDTDGIEFVEYVSAGLGEPSFGRDPDVLDGVLSSGAVGAFGGLIGPDLIATLSFRLTGAAGVFSITPSGTDGIGGPWISLEDFVTPIDVTYEGVTIVTPIPAAAWLFGSGLLALAGLRQRRRSP